jgi:chromosome segregation ATPase
VNDLVKYYRASDVEEAVKAVSEQLSAAKISNDDLGRQVDTLSEELYVLQGDLEHASKSLEETTTSLHKEIELRGKLEKRLEAYEQFVQDVCSVWNTGISRCYFPEKA